MGRRRIRKSRKRESEDRCFICKDGGQLHLCHYRQCFKAYHSRCLKKRNLSVPSSELSWHCSWHTCSKCNDPSTFFCYCCPTALCRNCVDAVYFFAIEQQYGLCHDCRRRVMFLENEKVKLKPLSRINRLFKEYYDIVKEDEGFSLENLQFPEERLRIKHKHKSIAYDSIEGLEKDDDIIELEGFKEERNVKLNCAEKSTNEEVVCETPDVLFASVVPDNIKLVFLKRSLIQELLKEPESFESKVKGSYVRVKSDPIDSHENNSYQLMQVTGVNMASNDQDADIKLQLLDMPNNVCINSLSDEIFSEEECKDLRQKMKVGLLKKPTLDEIEEKAKILHKDVVYHTLAREKRALESKIGYANEKGRRLLGLLEERKLLESPSHRIQLLSTPPKVIPEIQEPSNQLKGQSPMDERKRNEGYVSLSEELIGEKGSPKFVSPEQHSLPGKLSSLGKENQQNPIPAASDENVDVDELLGQLIEPDISCSSADSGSSDAVKDIKEGLILLLKQVPVSDFKSMISVTNGVFKCLRGLPINYISFYECVRNYIRSCYLLASTEEFKQASSMEELAIKYDLCKEYTEMTHERMMRLSTEITESITAMHDQVSDVEKSLVKYENEHLISETKHHSGSLRKVLETLKRLQDSVRNDLEPHDNSKKQYFEEIWEAFMNAKADLGL